MSWSPWHALGEELRLLGAGRAGWPVWGVLLANGVTVTVALMQGWTMPALLWPYWLQSLIGGALALRRILAVPEFSRVGLTVPEGYSMQATTLGLKWVVSVFFVIHFGFAHLLYALFIGAFTARAGMDVSWRFVLLGAALFVLNQYLIVREQMSRDNVRAPQVAALSAGPYLRVVPMHLTMVLGSMLGGGVVALVLFGVLKTLAELVGLRFEERLSEAMAASAPKPAA